MTLIEYSLVIALVVVGSVTSLDAMDSKVEAHYEQTALDVGKPSVSGFTVSTTTGGSSTSTTTSTTSSTSSTTTTTTTSPPTTSSTTTTTTTSPPTTSSTTTSPPTTTTSAPSGEPATVEAKNWSGYYGSFWKWDVYGELKFKDDDDDKLKNASVTYTITLATGETQTFSDITSSKGKIIVDWWGFPSSNIFPATITIDSVSKNGTTYNPSPSTFVWGV